MASKVKSHSSIIEGGGWVRVERIAKPRARFFGILAGVGVPVTSAALMAFWDGWPETFGSFERVCGGLIALHLLFVFGAGYYFLRERPVSEVTTKRDPDYDLRKLY